MKLSLSFAALVAGANAVFSPLNDVDTRSLDEIYAAAKKENGTLQVFWGGDAGAAGDEVRSSFAKRFPDIKFNLTVELSKYHDNQIDRGWYEGKHVADVAWLQTTHNYPRWKQEGKLVNYKPPTFNDILNGEKDFDGAWMAASLFGFGQMVYDSSKINASEVPTDYASITDPKFKGKLILTYPNDDDAIAYLFSLIIGRYGYDWLYALAKNDV
ncbi:hypothetical protein PRZ48_002963 [Zasmidium cellare]|uniref:Uncharacterized protein n=1 Tax=Zasmidium cellare TaxID=395010 RepID=A0ABR0EUQ6_ZASCE|nr:hypothetical protein PRZ48_002963 [Zasmidium cellare]